MLNKMGNIFTSTSTRTTTEIEPDEQPSSTSASQPKKISKSSNKMNKVKADIASLDSDETFSYCKGFLGKINDDESEALRGIFIEESINGRTLISAKEDKDTLNDLKSTLNLPLGKWTILKEMINSIVLENSDEDSGKTKTMKRKRGENKYDDELSNNGESMQIVKRTRPTLEQDDDDDNSSKVSDTYDDRSKTDDKRSSSSTSMTMGSKLKIHGKANTKIDKVEAKNNNRPGNVIAMEADIGEDSQTTIGSITASN